MRRYSIFVILAGMFMAISGLLYLLHYYIFRDIHHIFIYMVGDLAFLPLEVFIVVIVIERILTHREKQTVLQKLNMVIGAFFSEAGTALLKAFSDFDPCRDEICQGLIIDPGWSEQDFASARTQAKNYNYGIEIQKNNLEKLRDFLIGKRNFLLRLLENPNLLEHESFTELLRAVFHLSDELENREDVRELPDTDYQHLANDIKRAYVLLAREWVDYVRYLKSTYPYLFSFFMRMNPFDLEASPLVT